MNIVIKRIEVINMLKKRTIIRNDKLDYEYTNKRTPIKLRLKTDYNN